MKNEEAREATQAEVAQQKQCKDAMAELEAMRRAFEALYKLDRDAKGRAMRWLDTAIWGPRSNEEPPF